MSAPHNAESGYSDEFDREELEPDPRQFPSFRGPPRRPPPLLPAPAAPLAPSALRTRAQRGQPEPRLRISVSRRKWPALRALALVVGLGALALAAADLLPDEWRFPDAGRLLAALDAALQDLIGTAPSSGTTVPIANGPDSPSPAAADQADDKAEGSTFPAPLAAGKNKAEPIPPRQDPVDASTVTPEVASLALARGDALMKLRDVASARRFYELAAKAGLPQAARALGETYDPRYLRHLGAAGIQGDADKAALWYSRADDLARLQPAPTGAR